MTARARRAVALAVTVSAVFALSACGGSGPVRVAVPEPPPGGALAACRGLAGALPEKVMDAGRRSTSPRSEFTAAWGDSPVVLRCGVPRPALLDVADPVAAAELNSVGVNGVTWVFAPGARGVTFTTLYRAANVEVFVPKRFGQPTAPLVDVADAVRGAVPSTMDESEY
jgi:hypothetical protein